MARVTNRIAEFREQLGMSQAELASRAGTSQQQISRIEAGQRTDTFVALAICRELKRDLQTVFPGLPKLRRSKKGTTNVERLNAAILGLQDGLDKALADITRLRTLAARADASEESDASYGREEPNKVGRRMVSAPPANAHRLAESILSWAEAVRYAFEGSVDELATEIGHGDAPLFVAPSKHHSREHGRTIPLVDAALPHQGFIAPVALV